MKLSIIIVNWNVRDLLRQCLLSINAQRSDGACEVIVVDNASSDGSREMIGNEFSWVRLISMPSNVGFARANNRGIGEASGKYIFFLNPDTEVQPGALRKLVQYLDTHDAVALAAPQIINPDGSFQRGSVRLNPTVRSQAALLLELHHVLPSIADTVRYHEAHFDPSHEQPVEQVMGAAMCVRRTVLDRIGYFDERFFLWFEEVDLCSRLQKAGEKIIYYPDAKIIHHGGASFQQRLPVARRRIYLRSCVHYFAKHVGLGAGILVYCVGMISMPLMFGYQLLTRHARK